MKVGPARAVAASTLQGSLEKLPLSKAYKRKVDFSLQLFSLQGSLEKLPLQKAYKRKTIRYIANTFSLSAEFTLDIP